MVTVRPFRTCRTFTPTSLGQVEDYPSVAVLDPVGCGDAKSSVIPTGDDQIADAGGVAVG
jgi:hypothetical protein